MPAARNSTSGSSPSALIRAVSSRRYQAISHGPRSMDSRPQTARPGGQSRIMSKAESAALFRGPPVAGPLHRVLAAGARTLAQVHDDDFHAVGQSPRWGAMLFSLDNSDVVGHSATASRCGIATHVPRPRVANVAAADVQPLRGPNHVIVDVVVGMWQGNTDQLAVLQFFKLAVR